MPEPVPGLIDWKQDVFWRLTHAPGGEGRGWHPEQILRLTMPELMVACDDDMQTPRIPGGGVPMDPGQIAEHNQVLRSLTPRGRMVLMREGRL